MIRAEELVVYYLEMMQALKVDSLDDVDYGSLTRYHEKMAKVKVKR